MKKTRAFFYSKGTLVIVILGIVTFRSNAQQGPQFTQFMYNNLVINPAYAGAEEAFSLTMVSRNQWSGVEGAPSTQSFSAHTLVKKKHVGLGLTIIRDQLGVHKNTTALTNYAYHIKIKEGSFLSMGLQVGVANLKSDYASLQGPTIDPKLVSSINETTIGFGAGVYYRSPKLQIGLSAPELLSPTAHMSDTVSITFRKNTVVGYSRYRFMLSETLDMEPGLFVKYFPNLPVSFDVNLNFIYRKVLTGGVSYRKNESIDFIFKFQLTPQFQFGYAYDYPINSVTSLGSASHELLIHYVFRNVQKNVESSR
jgi:type IX secretion system PorP/SprF family membrane protein